MDMLPLKACYNHDRGVIELEDDVLSIVRQVRELYGRRITIELLPENPEPYAFVEHCEDKVDRLIFTCVDLDGRALERLQRSDSHSRQYVDPYEEAERAQDREQELRDEHSKEQLREVFRVKGKYGRQLLAGWLSWASHLRIPEFVALARSLRRYRELVHNTLDHALSNARSEATNTHLRALTKRAYGFHSPDALIAMALLTRGGLCPPLPGRAA